MFVDSWIYAQLEMVPAVRQGRGVILRFRKS